MNCAAAGGVLSVQQRWRESAAATQEERRISDDSVDNPAKGRAACRLSWRSAMRKPIGFDGVPTLITGRVKFIFAGSLGSL
jgi:hypothetical protein